MSTTLHKDLVGTDLHVNRLHADTHVVAGTDPLVLAESQVTDLPADLADLASDLNGKAPTVHVHVKADITDFPVLIPGTGNGDIVGPVSATPGNVATFADDTGKNIQDGGAIPTLSGLGAEAVANKSTSVVTDGASDTKYPSVKATKDYADGLIAGLLDYRGGYDASGNAYPTTGGSGTAGAVMKGDMWAISVAGTLGGVAIQVGDAIIAKIDTPAQTAGNWNTLNTNVSYVPEDQANKENTALDTSTVKYPSNAIVKAAVDAKAAYSEGTWTPTLNSATIVGAAPSVSGTYKRIGNLVFVALTIAAGALENTSVAFVNATTFIGNLPVAIAQDSQCFVIDNALTERGIGYIAASTGNMYMPVLSAKAARIVVTATYCV